MRRRIAALAAGMVLMMTGCSADTPATTPSAGGDDLYTAAHTRFVEFADGLHTVLMRVHEGDWNVAQRDYGAVPVACDSDGYRFRALRQLNPPGDDSTALAATAETALRELGLDVTNSVFGEGSKAQHNVVATGGVYDRFVVSIPVSTGEVTVTATSTCAPGDSQELAELVFDGTIAPEAWRLLPAIEGPTTQPRFFFPADGPVYYDTTGKPADPQPVPAQIPVRPTNP